MTGATTSEIFGLLGAIVALAGLSVAIIYGKQTAAILKAGGDAFTSSIGAATLQSGRRTVAR